jgi:acyl carrier protein
MAARSDGVGSRDQDVLPALAEIVRLVTSLDAAQVQRERHFVDDLRIDSLSMVEILEGAAQRFGVRIEDEAAKDFIRVGDLVDHISARLR